MIPNGDADLLAQSTGRDFLIVDQDFPGA